ncbi:hypothetical protein [Thauera sp.]|uniref:ABC transporter permease subunit n=1 Tax=Thauera sp. TaxID=1905334 RepID=UPI00257FA1AD|nr:hypothetical protein [Thauera sp.]
MDFDWLFLAEIVLAGLGAGGLYALTGLAFVMIYKATRVVNLAIGEMLMIGAYLCFGLATAMNMPMWLAILVAVIGSGVAGATLERVAIRPMLGESPIITGALGMNSGRRPTRWASTCPRCSRCPGRWRQ